MTTVSDGLFQYGGIPVGGVFTTGRAWFVKPYSGSDGNTGKSPSKAFKTLAKALASATADKGEVVYLIAESNTASATTDYQAAALDWNKDGVHLVGINNGSMIGQRSRIAELSTVKTIEDLFTVSADNCLIANIEVFQGVASSTATAARAVVVSGQRNRFVNCQFSGNGDTAGSTDDAGARSLAITGSENSFKHCYIGLDTVIRATQAAEVEIVGTVGAKVARTIFEDCVINSYTSADGFLSLKTTYIDRFVILKNCMVCATQTATSATAPAAAIANTTPNGAVYLHGTSFFGFDNVTSAGDSSTLISSFGPGTIADTGLANATVIS